MLAKPLPPFADWPLDYADPRYGFAWYLGEGVIVSQAGVTHGNVAAANAYHDYEESMLGYRGEEIATAGGLFVIHDWRVLATYDTAARNTWQTRMKARKKGYLRGSVVCVANATPLLRMAVQAANLVASMTHNAKVELSTNLDQALRRHQIKPPGVRRPSRVPGR